MMNKIVVHNDDLIITQKVAQALARFIQQAPFLCFLRGNLGAGKTTLMRYYLAALGYGGKVKSPTFTLVESYNFPEFTVNHFDLYRIAEKDELNYIGMQEYLSSGVNFIEWPENGADVVRDPDLICELSFDGNSRSISFSTKSQDDLKRLEKLLADVL
jgi:tRNA threonylcarbamoyladenosine biosynthesis protein TsaE